MQLQAKAGATITTYVFINDTSLLGKNDAMRLGIIKLNLRGVVEEVDSNGKDGGEEVNRIKMMRLSELKKADTKESGQNTRAREKQMGQLLDVFKGIGKYEGPEHPNKGECHTCHPASQEDSSPLCQTARGSHEGAHCGGCGGGTFGGGRGRDVDLKSGADGKEMG